MKKLIAAAGLGAAVTLGSLAGAGVASATTSEDNFVTMVNNTGIYSHDGDYGLLQVGYGACGQMRSGWSAGAIASDIAWYGSNITYSQGLNEVYYAAVYLCPSQLWKVL